jgi:leader peptidase (prepilin peptidase) / N-methyltransferase
LTTALVAAAAFIFGALLGSFLNVCISRWPAGESVVNPPRSRCPRCGTQIAWFDNIPVISWLVLRGRCRSCGEPISALYPIVELSTALLWLAAFVAFGPTFFALRVAVFATILLGIAVTDARVFDIPDGFTVFGFIWILGSATVAWFLGDDTRFASPGDAFIGACAGAGAVAIAMWLGEVALRREAMGFGDVTLMAVVGAAVGPVRALVTVFVAALLAVISLPLLRLVGLPRESLPGANVALHSATSTEHLDTPAGHIPFGVFLAPAAFITLLWGDLLIGRYLQWVSSGSPS